MTPLLLLLAMAPERVVIVGGGYRPEASQVQIELNVRWLQRLLAERKAGSPIDTVFAGGDALTALDVVESRADTSTRTLPLARLYGGLEHHNDTFFHNRVVALDADTKKSRLVARLEWIFARGDPMLFVYNGHGLGDPEDPSKNTLRLWGDEHLSAVELKALLNKSPPEARIRMFFPQCFSGGFAHVMFNRDKLVDADRCAFFSQDELLEAEGCTPSVNVDDYRDYTTYFFSALAGATRSGRPLGSEPDRDKNGVVSLREAHWFALATADSADLPRSSSEAYLERWAPWHLRSGPRAPNVYVELARAMATRLELGADPLREALRRRAEVKVARQKLADEKTAATGSVERTIRAVRLEVESRWPALARPYTAAFVDLHRSAELDAAIDFIRKAPEYSAIVAMQDRLRSIELEDLALRRTGAGLDRYFRARRLAGLLSAFEDDATARERERFAKLLACEDAPL